MLYHLLPPLSDIHFIFNVFTYITFRSAGAVVTSLLFAFLLGPPTIRALRRLNVGEVVRTVGPETHQVKEGTPTMGGVLILSAATLSTLLWAPLNNPFVMLSLGALLWMGAIGFLDDYLKVVKGKRDGLVARYKLVGQVSFGTVLALYLLLRPIWGSVDPTVSMVPFFADVVVRFAAWAYVLFVIVVITGSSNGVNLTDGLDGLAAGLTAIAAIVIGLFAYLIGRVDSSAYLGLLYFPGAAEMTVFAVALAGAAIGFLWFNAHPAEVFMGDTGSLALGGAIGTMAILLKTEFLLVIVGGVFVMETLSVVIQRVWFRHTKKKYGEGRRVFRMAPIHHHFEKLGWAETKVVIRFWILGILCAMLAFSTLKIR